MASAALITQWKGRFEREARCAGQPSAALGPIPTDVVVLAGADAGRESSGAVRTALAAAGDHADVMRVGPSLAKELDERRPDFVFPCVFGELSGDGALQDALELVGVPYVGSQANAVRSCADKSVTKRALAGAGLPTPPAWVVAGRTSLQWGTDKVVARIMGTLDGPVVVKPLRGTAGLGVRIVAEPDHLSRVVTAGLLYAPQVMIEPFVLGRELSVVVVERQGKAQVLGMADVRRPDGLDPPTSSIRTFAPLGPGLKHRSGVARLATEAFAALGCRDFAVVDLVIDEWGEPWLLELDTALEFETDGKVAAAAADGGLSLTEAILLLCERCRDGRRADRRP